MTVLRGRCACGATEYEVEDAFVYAMNCHCSKCRAATGAAYKPMGGIEREKLRITRADQSQWQRYGRASPPSTSKTSVVAEQRNPALLGKARQSRELQHTDGSPAEADRGGTCLPAADTQPGLVEALPSGARTAPWECTGRRTRRSACRAARRAHLGCSRSDAGGS